MNAKDALWREHLEAKGRGLPYRPGFRGEFGERVRRAMFNFRYERGIQKKWRIGRCKA